MEERKKAAFRILDNFKKIDKAWDIVDEYRETGRLPQKDAPAVITDPAQAIKRRGNLRTYISKFRNNPDRAEDVKAWEKELEELNKVIDG